MPENAVAVQKDGTIVAAGASGAPYTDRQKDDFAVVRYTASGKLDPGFGRGGKVLSHNARRRD
jgi:hypothetical protein